MDTVKMDMNDVKTEHTASAVRSAMEERESLCRKAVQRVTGITVKDAVETFMMIESGLVKLVVYPNGKADHPGECSVLYVDDVPALLMTPLRVQSELDPTRNFYRIRVVFDREWLVDAEGQSLPDKG